MVYNIIINTFSNILVTSEFFFFMTCSHFEDHFRFSDLVLTVVFGEEELGLINK